MRDTYRLSVLNRHWGISLSSKEAQHPTISERHIVPTVPKKGTISLHSWERCTVPLSLREVWCLSVSKRGTLSLIPRESLSVLRRCAPSSSIYETPPTLSGGCDGHHQLHSYPQRRPLGRRGHLGRLFWVCSRGDPCQILSRVVQVVVGGIGGSFPS